MPSGFQPLQKRAAALPADAVFEFAVGRKNFDLIIRVETSNKNFTVFADNKSSRVIQTVNKGFSAAIGVDTM